MIGAIVAKIKAKAAFKHFNNRDIKAFLSNWKKDVVFTYPGKTKASGTFEGKQVVEKWFLSMFEQFPQFTFVVKNIYVKNIFDLVGTNTIVVEWDVDLENKKGEKFHNAGLTVIKIRFAKILSAQDYIFDTGQKFHEGWI